MSEHNFRLKRVNLDLSGNEDIQRELNLELEPNVKYMCDNLRFITSMDNLLILI